MFNMMRDALSGAVRPLFQRPRALQMAALCHRDTDEGREVLLVTSSHGRWILPKGWPIDGKTGGETAMQEAWEEAGVKSGKVEKAPVGTFLSTKRMANGPDLACETSVYAIKVKTISDSFPEAKKRKRRWVKLPEAVNMVEDRGLRQLLSGL